MDAETPGKTEESSVASIKKLRSQLESRIESRHKTHLDLLSSLQNLVPNLVSSLDLSLNLISNLNHRNFIPTPPLPEIPNLPPKPHANHGNSNNNVKQEPAENLVRSMEGSEDEKRSGKFVVDESGSPMAVVKAMVATCLLQRVPFKPVDSSIIARKLESDANLTAAEKKALRELGGEAGAVLAVEAALKSIAEDNGGVELDELSISGKSRVMVLSIDKIRLLRELPKSVQVKQEVKQELNEGGNNQNQNQGQMDMYGFQRPEMWDPHMAEMASIYGGGGLMGPRGRGGMMGMHRGGMMNSSNRQQKRTEEDDWIDIQEMLSKKTYKESQRSKAGEELLDLIQRPTAKETAVAAKVFGAFELVLRNWLMDFYLLLFLFG